jgi:hypothetical protein
MHDDIEPPWASGPGEILQHGRSLLQKDTDSNRRLAMISIDNAVELMIKTYLGLPKRITELSISRKEYAEVSESFPALIDALEKYSPKKLEGIDLGTIEWYHRLRNQLYHQGNGLTVERDKVEAYAVLANQLFFNLFGVPLLDHVTPSADQLGEFIKAWTTIERGISALAKREIVRLNLNESHPRSPLDTIRQLKKTQLISETQMIEFDHLRRIRNEVLHGHSDYREKLTPGIISRAQELANQLSEYAEKNESEL